MHWLILFGTLTACLVFLAVLWKLPCAIGECETERCDKPQPDTTSSKLNRSMTACQEAFRTLEEQRAQLHYRLQTLDEMIEKSDREILKLHDQLSRMENIRRAEHTETDLAMLSFLQAGGYDREEIARFIGKDLSYLERN